MVRERPKQTRCAPARLQPAAARRAQGAAARKPSLEEVILQLQHLRSAVIVAIAALRRQNCELDEDIASLLQRCVCDSLHDQLRKLEEARRPRATRVRRV
jgi:hypothetical protein